VSAAAGAARGLAGSVIVAIAYALLADLDAPVLRATLMLVTLAAAAWVGGLARPSRALALAWLIVVGSDPLGLLAPGLWLSFGAVAAILYLNAGARGAQGYWRELMQLQVLLSLALAPLTLFFFQGASWIGPLANLLALPTMALLLPALLSVLLLASIWPAVGVPALKLVADAIDWAFRGCNGSPRMRRKPGCRPVRSRPRCCSPRSASCCCARRAVCRCGGWRCCVSCRCCGRHRRRRSVASS